MRFTVDEFHTMVEELLYTNPSRFDMLCTIATRALEPMVRSWCRKDSTLRGRGYEADVMQGILLHLMKKVVHGFLLNDRTEQPYNDDPEGFERWMTTVAHNYQRDFANRVRGVDFRTDDGEDALDAVASADDDWVTRNEQQETLRAAFDAVLASDQSVYKVLTWWAQVVFIADEGLEHHEANRKIVDEFEHKTLFEMYCYVLSVSKTIPWMTPSLEQHRRVMAALQKPKDGDQTYGEMTYGEFFMMYRGKPDGNKSVSDWVYRVNSWICRTHGSDRPAKKSAAMPGAGKKRRDEDESSDIG